MPLATLRIDSETHRRLKEQANKGGYKINRLAALVLDEWLSGELSRAAKRAVQPHSRNRGRARE